MKSEKIKEGDLKSAFANRQKKESEKISSSNEAENKKKFIDRFGQDKLDKWKSEFGGRELICLKHDDDMAVLRPVTADDLGDYMTSIGTNGMSKAVAFILEQLWLEGDHPLVENEDKFIAVFMQINNILEGKKAEFFRF